MEDPAEVPLEAFKAMEAVSLEGSLEAPKDTPALMEADAEAELLSPEERERLLAQMKELETERGQLTAEVLTKDTLVSNLEREVSSLRAEVAQNETRHASAVAEHERKFMQLSEEMGAKVAELRRQFVAANKEKEAMVMKFALGEKDIIIQKRQKEEAERKMRAALKDKEDAHAKAKTAVADKIKMQLISDSRLQDAVVLKKDIEKWKEEVKVQEAKATVAAGRLKAEVDAHRETREKLDATIAHLAETRGEIDQTRKECADFMKKFKEDEVSKQKRALAVEKEQSVKLMIDEAAASELVTLRDKFAKVIEENNELSLRVQSMEKERLVNEENLCKLKEACEGQKREIVDLMAQVAEMESLRMQLSRLEEKHLASQAEVERLRCDSVETSDDMDACRKKEAELLEFTQKLTEKNVTLQSDLASAEGRAAALEGEHARLSGHVAELEASKSQLTIELGAEKKKRSSESEMLAQKLAQKSVEADKLRQQTLDAENEVQVLKRKNMASLRELTRELKDCKRRLEAATSNNNGTVSPTVLSQSSRASSNSSLNRLTVVAPPNSSCTEDEAAAVTHSPTSTSSNGSRSNLPSHSDYSCNGIRMNPGQVPDNQVLVEKIVKLQGDLARRQEKLEFMEEHVSTLVEEMKKKNRLLTHYLVKQEPGALSSSEMDENKKRAAEHGGIMASLYSSKPSDSRITLELSLEINQKLQAVLEDTLLKNITLKENINTLGREIANLSASK